MNIFDMGPHTTSGMLIYGPWCGYIWAHPYLARVCIIFVIWAHTPLAVWVYIGQYISSKGMHNICYVDPHDTSSMCIYGPTCT